jgi:uncharacterized protein (DUF302 family)
MSHAIRTGRTACLVMLASAAAALAQDIKVVTKTGDFEDTKFELTNAITARGLTIDYNGQLGRMLERTGADVGSTKPIYKNAEFFTFCSAKLSRAMMEADPLNAAFCPYVVFIFETATEPGKITAAIVRRRSPASPRRTRRSLTSTRCSTASSVRPSSNVGRSHRLRRAAELAQPLDLHFGRHK